ncbi:hypothetical protein OH492_08055 [Vibrio chagasii]|nr:hypothetical protein [Vibrio chagasii]
MVSFERRINPAYFFTRIPAVYWNCGCKYGLSLRYDFDAQSAYFCKDYVQHQKYHHGDAIKTVFKVPLYRHVQYGRWILTSVFRIFHEYGRKKQTCKEKARYRTNASSERLPVDGNK